MEALVQISLLSHQTLDIVLMGAEAVSAHGREALKVCKKKSGEWGREGGSGAGKGGQSMV